MYCVERVPVNTKLAQICENIDTFYRFQNGHIGDRKYQYLDIDPHNTTDNNQF